MEYYKQPFHNQSIGQIHILGFQEGFLRFGEGAGGKTRRAMILHALKARGFGAPYFHIYRAFCLLV
jgi:hypothetical protein